MAKHIEDIKLIGKVFVPKKGGAPSEVLVTDIMYGEPPEFANTILGGCNPPVLFKYVTFSYIWDGQAMSASLRKRKFLTEYKLKDLH